MSYKEAQATAATSADNLRGVVRSALEAAGWHVTAGENWSKTLWVRESPDHTLHQAVADITVGLATRDYSTVVEVIINPRWRIERKVSYWAGQKDGYTFSAEKVAKIVAKVQSIATTIKTKAEAEARRDAWKAVEADRKAQASKPVEAFIKEHGITNSYVPNVTRYLQEWSARPSPDGTDLALSTFSVKLEYLTEAQMLAVLAVIKPEAKS